MEIKGKRVGCWWCDGDIIHHPEEKQIIADWADFESDEEMQRVIAVYKCTECNADILVSNADGVKKDRTQKDAPEDVNRCPQCGGYAVWQSDFCYDEVYGEGQGIVTYLKCMRCGAELEYSLRDD